MLHRCSKPLAHLGTDRVEGLPGKGGSMEALYWEKGRGSTGALAHLLSSPWGHGPGVTHAEAATQTCSLRGLRSRA